MEHLPLERISIDPAVMNGQPCVRGTRITVKRVLYAGKIAGRCASRRRRSAGRVAHQLSFPLYTE